MKYDDASWHYDGDFPKGLPKQNGATHIGMFLAWAIERDLVSDELCEDAGADIARVKRRKMTGAQFLMTVCDEALSSHDLSAEGNRFAKAYFMKAYMEDYADLFEEKLESLYELADTWKNYDRLRPIIEQRYATSAKAPKKTAAKKAAAKKTTAKKTTAKKTTAKKTTAKKTTAKKTTAKKTTAKKTTAKKTTAKRSAKPTQA
jgi:Histone H1-like nucleoprotein HC2